MKKREVERELVERSDNGALPLVIVPYFDPTGSTNAPPSEGESVVILGGGPGGGGLPGGG